jgi:hypothetical protein
LKFDPRFAGLKPAEDDGFLMATSFGGEVKPSVPCHKILQHDKEPYRSGISWAKFTAIFRQVSPALLPDISDGYCQRSLVDKSGMISTQMGTYKRTQMVAVLGTPCYTTP